MGPFKTITPYYANSNAALKLELIFIKETE